MVVQDIYRDGIAGVLLDESASVEFLGATDIVGENDSGRVEVKLEEGARFFRIKDRKFKQFASSSCPAVRITGRVYDVPVGVDFVDVRYWKYEGGVVYEVNGIRINPFWEYEQIERRDGDGS